MTVDVYLLTVGALLLLGCIGLSVAVRKRRPVVERGATGTVLVYELEPRPGHTYDVFGRRLVPDDDPFNPGDDGGYCPECGAWYECVRPGKWQETCRCHEWAGVFIDA